MYVTKFLQIKA